MSLAAVHESRAECKECITLCQRGESGGGQGPVLLQAQLHHAAVVGQVRHVVAGLHDGEARPAGLHRAVLLEISDPLPTPAERLGFTALSQQCNLRQGSPGPPPACQNSTIPAQASSSWSCSPGASRVKHSARSAHQTEEYSVSPASLAIPSYTARVMLVSSGAAAASPTSPVQYTSSSIAYCSSHSCLICSSVLKITVIAGKENDSDFSSHATATCRSDLYCCCYQMRDPVSRFVSRYNYYREVLRDKAGRDPYIPTQ